MISLFFSLKDFLNYDFLQYALLGTFIFIYCVRHTIPLIIARRNAFMGSAISHSTLLGIAISSSFFWQAKISKSFFNSCYYTCMYTFSFIFNL